MPATVLRLDNFRQERNMLASMRIAVIGGGPGRALLQRARPAARASDRAASRDHRVGAQRRRRHLRLRGGVQRRDARRHRARRSRRSTPGCSAEFAVWDDIDVHFKGEVVTSGGHGFAAMSRRRLLEILQDRCRELGVDDPLPHRGPRRRRARPRPTTWWSPATGSTRRSGRRYADTFRPTLERARLQVHLARHRQGLRRLQVLHRADARTASCRSTATPTTPPAARSSSR